MKTRSAYNPNGVKNFELASTSLFADASLVSYWKMEGNSNDSKGSNNGTDTAITYGNAYGKFGQGALFNGSTSTIKQNVFNIATTNISYSMWVYWTLTSSNSFIFYNGNSGSNGYGIQIGDGAGGNGNKILVLLGGTSFNALSSTYTMPSNRWVNIVLTRGASTWTLYVDGISVATGTTNPGSIPSGVFSIGASNISDSFNGNIDDFAFFSRELSSTEVGYLYSLGTTKAYYPLNGNSTDYSGNGNHGTDTAITYPQGKFGQGAKFNGSSSYISIPNITSLNGSSYLTYSAWVKINTLSSFRAFISKASVGDGNNRSILGQSASASGDVWCQLSNGSNSYGYTSTLLKTGIFYHLTMVFDGTKSTNADRLKVYINGVENSLTYSGTIPATTTGLTYAQYIGAEHSSGGFTDSIIDEVIIENRAWTAQEISLYYRKSMLNYRPKGFGQVVYTYITELLKGSYTLTGKNMNTLYNRVATLLKGAYTLTGKQLSANKAYVATLLKGAYTLTGKILSVPNRWINQSKNTSTWTNETKNNSSWTNTPKS